MATKLKPEVQEKILRIAKKMRPEAVRIEIGRLLWTHSHCGQRMVQVKIFDKQQGLDCAVHKTERRDLDLYACQCPDCPFAFRRPLGTG